ncbi:hypothetical protein H0H93_001443 [Arthromyces matolae]|nr:hypothetical protein H0H93_001443 [Arthromyces matolae]
MSADDLSEMLYDGLPELIDIDNEDLPPPRRSQRLHQVQYSPMDLDHGENENDEKEEEEYTPLSPKRYQRSDPVSSSPMDVDVIEEDTIEHEARDNHIESVLPDDPLVPEIMSLNQQILGLPHLRTPDAPHKVRKEFIGGTHFECSGAEPVKPNTRCYTLGPTHQHPQNLMSATSAGKVESDGTISDDVKLR